MAVGAVTLLGHGRLGSALAEGWRRTSTVADLTILTRADAPVVPLGSAALVLAVKPGSWRDAVQSLDLPATTTVISLMAGVRAVDISALLPGRPIVRVMPTTAVAQAQGVAAIWSTDEAATRLAHALFDPVADTVDLPEEPLMDAATAVAGSAPAFFYALAMAIAEAGVEQGLAPEASARLARGALRSAGAGAGTGDALDDLIERIASPGGTTRAGLAALQSGRLGAAAQAAVHAAVQRARDLAGDQTA